MSSAKIVLFKSKILSDGTNPVLLRVIIDRKPVYNGLGGSNFKCISDQWDIAKSVFNSKFPDWKRANRNLSTAIKNSNKILLDLEDEDPNFSHEDFRKLYDRKTKKLYLFKYIDELCERLESSGKIGNQSIYKTMRNAFFKFVGSEIEMKGIDSKKLAMFVESCEKRGLKPNSINNYLRTLRAVYNKAIKEEGLDYYPFKNFNWKNLSTSTEKRAISKSDMIRMINFACEAMCDLDQARHLFAFQYLNYGINFADLAKIEKSNIIETDGQHILSYHRSKGGRLYQIPLDSFSLSIIGYFQSYQRSSKYIFPILDEDIQITPKQIRTRIQTALKKYNAELRSIAEALEIDKHITSYVSRHTFATVLAKGGEDLFTISGMLGHSDLKTTQIYLKGLDHSDKVEASKKLTN